jgi:hypothetical protein
MWKCSNCDESVEDSFEICWNCGATRDGAIDSKFQPEPDDPDVPDPGVASDTESEYRESDLATGAVSGGPMNRQEVAALICKSLALLLFAVAACFAVTVLSISITLLMSEPWNRSISSFLVVLLPGLFVFSILIVGIVYWKKSNAIAARMVSADPTPVTLQSINVQDLTVLAFSIVGIVFLVEGILEFLRVVFLSREFAFTPSEFWYNSATLTALVQLALAFWLVLGSRGIVRLIYWLRTAGVPNSENEPEGEEAD